MPEPPDPYAVLGVPPTATQEEIRAAYHELALRYHPDRHRGNPLEDLAGERLAQVNAAYEMLGDPARRAAHDAARRDAPPDRAGGLPRLARGLLALVGLVLFIVVLSRVGGLLVRALAVRPLLGVLAVAALVLLAWRLRR